jgi:WD40 repeat protein
MSRDSQDDAEARPHREEALRALSQQTTPAATPQPRGSLARALPPPHRRRTLHMLAIMVVLVAILVVAGTVSGLAPWARRAGPVTTQRVSIILSHDRLSCATSAVWSPDGTRIAVLASTGNCAIQGNAGAPPQVVAIYDPHGNLIQQLRPDTLTLGHGAPMPGASPPAISTPMPTTSAIVVTAQYMGLSWSPDGSQLALGYLTASNDPQAAHPEVLDMGVAFLRADGSGGQLLHQPRDSNSRVWDTRTGAATGEDTSALAPALTYTWEGSALVSGSSDAVRNTGAVGVPTGGQSFTIWQPGVIGYDAQSGALSYSTTFLPWSPDGHFVGAEVSLPFFLATSGPTFQPAHQGIPTIIYRDAAMRQVANDLKGGKVTAGGAPIAWRPDGQRLAARVPEKDFVEAQQQRISPYAPEHVTIRDCATGRQIATLTTASVASAPADSYDASEVAWSPSGRQLLLLDTAYGVLTVWGPAGLAA